MTLRPNRLPSTFVLLAAVGLATAAVAACETAVTPPPHDPHVVTTAVPTVTAPVAPPRSSDPGSVDEAALDPSVSACEDFYQHACGGWIKATPIPGDESSWTRSFDVIGQANEKLLRAILEQDAKAPPADEPYSKQLGDYYASCIDEEAIEKAGVQPLEPFLKAIGKVKDPKSLAVLLGDFQKKGIDNLFDFESGQDFKDATQVIGQLSQGGLGLPDRDYYLKDDPKMKELRATYEGYVAKMLGLAGEKEAAAKLHAKAVMALETALARASMSNEDQRNPKKIYHRLERAGIEKQVPGFPWEAYFKATGAPEFTALNVAQPEFFGAVDILMSASPSVQCKDDKAPKGGKAGADKGVADRAASANAPASPIDCPSQPKKFPASEIQTYLRFHLVDSLARTLPKRFVDASFEMERALTGAEELPPRWKRCVRGIDYAMGEAIAVPFVKKVLGDQGKADVRQIVANIEAALGERLGALKWMDDATRAKAQEKLAAVANKIAYPDKFRSYDSLVVTRGKALDNRLNATELEMKRRLAKIGKPLDRTEWFYPPQVVNAGYDASLNEMQFPAGILQSPFYAAKAQSAMNYGAIGMVVGHELTHGFDDEGRQFDARGNLSDWWSAPVGQEFDRRAACVEKQFDGYVAVGDVHVKGKLTLGENIADLGGLKLAFAAWQKASGGQRGTAKYPDEQQFFYGYAQAWCTNMREETLRLLVQTNAHSPPRFRVNGPLSNMPEFQEAFQCKAGPMVRADRCEVW
jgi:putative endopeptidase